MQCEAVVVAANQSVQKLTHVKEAGTHTLGWSLINYSCDCVCEKWNAKFQETATFASSIIMVVAASSKMTGRLVGTCREPPAARQNLSLLTKPSR